MTVLLSSVSGEPAEAIGDQHGRHVVLARGGYAVSEVAKGFRQRRFFDLSDRDKRDILKLMARVAEQAYRRGAQQGAGLAGKPSFRGDLWEWRYRPSLDLSPRVDSPTTTTRLDRLDAEWRATARAGVLQSQRCQLVASWLDGSPMAAGLGRVHTGAAPFDPGRKQARGRIAQGTGVRNSAL